MGAFTNNPAVNVWLANRMAMDEDERQRSRQQQWIDSQMAQQEAAQAHQLTMAGQANEWDRQRFAEQLGLQEDATKRAEDRALNRREQEMLRALFQQDAIRAPKVEMMAGQIPGMVGQLPIFNQQDAAGMQELNGVKFLFRTPEEMASRSTSIEIAEKSKKEKAAFADALTRINDAEKSGTLPTYTADQAREQLFTGQITTTAPALFAKYTAILRNSQPGTPEYQVADIITRSLLQTMLPSVYTGMGPVMNERRTTATNLFTQELTRRMGEAGMAGGITRENLPQVTALAQKILQEKPELRQHINLLNLQDMVWGNAQSGDNPLVRDLFNRIGQNLTGQTGQPTQPGAGGIVWPQQKDGKQSEFMPPGTPRR